MRKKLVLGLLTLMLFLFCGCGSEGLFAPKPTDTPVPTEEPTPTPSPSPSPTPYVFDLYGVQVSSEDTVVDLSNIPIYTTEKIEEAIPYLTSVEKIDLSFCGISYEDLDALNQKYPDIQIVWTMYLDSVPVRTDATYFIASVRHDPQIDNSNTWLLKYCPDLIALDLGHCEDVSDLSFLYDLPKLEYLILAECNINDITPIGSLENLKYLEMFWTKCEDLSPLLQCKKLLDLNVCYIYSRGDPAFETLSQMTQLERLWYCGTNMSLEQQEELQALLPNCEMYLEPHGESTGGTWREHERYFEMRDAFEMYYMQGGIN